jgi:hypothetical protein
MIFPLVSGQTGEPNIIGFVEQVDSFTWIQNQAYPLGGGKFTNLVRSYKLQSGDYGFGTAFAERVYIQDQALAIIQAVLTKNGSSGYVESAIGTQRIGGWFPFYVAQNAPQGTTDLRISTLAHAWMIYALAFWYNREVSSPVTGFTAIREQALQSINDAVDWLYQLGNSNTGFQEDLYVSGKVISTGILETNCVIEDNLLVWFALQEAARATSRTTMLWKADRLKKAILTHLWNDSSRRFRAAVSSPTTYNESVSLLSSSWGALWLDAVHETEKRDCAMQRVQDYFITQSANQYGHKPYTSANTIWGDGSFGVALAWYRFGRFDKYNETMAGLAFIRNGLGGYGQTTVQDSTYNIELFSQGSVASTAWFSLATSGRDEIFNPNRHAIVGTRVVSSVNSLPVLARSASENLSGLFIDSSIQETQIDLGQNISKFHFFNWKNDLLYTGIDIYSKTRNGSTLQLTGETLLGQLSRRPAPSRILERGVFTPQAALELILTRWNIPFVAPVPEMMLRGTVTPVAGSTPPSGDGKIRVSLEAITITWANNEKPPFIRQVLEELFSAFDGYYFRMSKDNRLEVIAPSWSYAAYNPALTPVLTNDDLQENTWTKDVRDELVINRCEVTNQGYEFVNEQTIAPDSMLEAKNSNDPDMVLPRDVIAVPSVYLSSAIYAEGDAVMFNGKRYRRINDFNLSVTGDPLIGTSGYEPFDISGTPVQWNVGATYNRGDVVYTRGFSGLTAIDVFYRANIENTGFDPDLNTNRGNNSPAKWRPLLWETSRFNGFVNLNETTPIGTYTIDDDTSVLGNAFELEILITYHYKIFSGAIIGLFPQYTIGNGTATRFVSLAPDTAPQQVIWKDFNNRNNVFIFYRNGNTIRVESSLEPDMTIPIIGGTAFAARYELKIKTRGSKYQRSNVTTKAIYGETIHDAASAGLSSSRTNYGVRERNISINRFKLDAAACLAIAQNVVEQNLEPPLEYKGNLVPPFRANPDMLGRNIELPNGDIGILESWSHSEAHQAGSSSTNMSIKVRVKP